MNSRTSTNNNGKKRPTNNSNIKKKKASSSTNTTPKKKKIVNTMSVKKVNTKTQSKKKNTTKTPVKKQNVKQTKTVNQKPRPVKKNVVKQAPRQTESNVRKSKMKVQEVDADIFAALSGIAYTNNEDKVDDLEYINVDGFEEYNQPRKIKKKPQNIENKSNVEKIENKEQKERLISPLTIVTISFVIALIIAGGYLMLNLEYFNLTNIKVTGNTKYTNEVIIKNCSLKIGNNVFKELISKDYNKSEVPYVSQLNYSYNFPNEIVIEVEERYPEYIAKDKNSEKYYMLDNQGYILEECTIETKGDALLIEGLAFETNVEFGSQVNEVYIRKLKKYKEIKQLLKEAGLPTNITKVNFNASLTIITVDDKLNIVFSNESNLRYRVSFLKSIIEQNGALEEGTIDMSLENPVYSKYD